MKEQIDPLLASIGVNGYLKKIANDPQCPPEMLEEIFFLFQGRIVSISTHEEFIEHPGCTEKMLDFYSNGDQVEQMRVAVASRRHGIPQSIQEKLLHDRSDRVRQALAMNTHCDAYILAALKTDPSANVRTQALADRQDRFEKPRTKFNL